MNIAARRAAFIGLGGATVVAMLLANGQPSLADAFQADVSPIALQSLATNDDAKKLNKTLAEAVSRVPGVSGRLIDNTVSPASFKVLVVDGKGLSAAGNVANPTTDAPLALQKRSQTVPDHVTIQGNINGVTGFSRQDAPVPDKQAPADFLVSSTLKINADDSVVLSVFATRVADNTTAIPAIFTATNAADLNKKLAAIDLSRLFPLTATRS